MHNTIDYNVISAHVMLLKICSLYKTYFSKNNSKFNAYEC